MKNYPVHYKTIQAGIVNIFYREAGPKDAPIILLMHGYPTSSVMFRNLIPALSKKNHVIAPDLPGFGFSDAPPRSEYIYSFDNLAKTMQAFIDTIGLQKFSMYIFDYGAPVGLRLALANPEKITGIISQNGNAYAQGLLDWSNGPVMSKYNWTYCWTTGQMSRSIPSSRLTSEKTSQSCWQYGEIRILTFPLLAPKDLSWMTPMQS